MRIHQAKPLDFFNRYKSIIDDWDAFEAYVQKPLPATIWTNSLKTTPAALASKIPLEPVVWYPGAFRCPPDIKPATLLPYLSGHYQIQEEVALLPVALMNPQPGETILDMCAAPGNKSVQMAVAMKSTGLVVANDRSRARLGILRRSISRLGLTNVAITASDATSLSGQPESYDHILADVPCSGEGTIRRYKKTTFFISSKRRDHFRNIQSAILNKAIKLCKPGGLIVYSTCTFAPEENEMIINAALLKHPDQLSVVETKINGFKTSPGLLEWGGYIFHPDLKNTHRIWPHQNDTGGFFVAVIKKGKSTKQPLSSVKMKSIESASLALPSQIFQERFGLPSDTFNGYSLQQFGKFLFIKSFDALPSDAPPPIQNGLPFCRPPGKSQKMKTGAAIKWGSAATQNVIELSSDQTYAYGNGHAIEIGLEKLMQNTSPGYVLLKHQDMHLGLGFLRVKGNKATIESLLPKHWINAAQISISPTPT